MPKRQFLHIEIKPKLKRLAKKKALKDQKKLSDYVRGLMVEDLKKAGLWD